MKGGKKKLKFDAVYLLFMGSFYAGVFGSVGNVFGMVYPFYFMTF